MCVSSWPKPGATYSKQDSPGPEPDIDIHWYESFMCSGYKIWKFFKMPVTIGQSKRRLLVDNKQQQNPKDSTDFHIKKKKAVNLLMKRPPDDVS